MILLIIRHEYIDESDLGFLPASQNDFYTYLEATLRGITSNAHNANTSRHSRMAAMERHIAQVDFLFSGSFISIIY